MADEPTRESLRSRQLPEMQLSTAGNPLTAPRPPRDGLTAAQRAQHRFSVKGNVIITGGTGTLALEAAAALLEHGASGLALWDLDPDSAFPAVKSLHQRFPTRTIITEAVDVRDEDQIASALASTIKLLGSVSSLCCFAGVVSCVPAIDMSAATWRNTHDVNLTGSFLCAQAFARQVRVQNTSSPDSGGGSIVFVASISAHATNFPQPQAAYNSSKAALLSLTKSLAAEWAHLGIRVNALSPGYMDTILNEGEGLARARESWNGRNPLGRMGVPWELTGPLVTLVSEAGRYVNGTDVVVDGGAMVF